MMNWRLSFVCSRYQVNNIDYRVENKNSPQKLPPVQIQAHAQEIERMEMKIRDHFGEETKLMKSIAGLDGKI